MDKPKVKYIAGNIPLPTRKSNKVIIDIAERLSVNYDISVIYPKEFCPFPVTLLGKFRHLKGIPKNWRYNNINIQSLEYFRLPGNTFAFSLLGLSEKKIVKIISKEKPQLIHAHYTLPDGYLALMAYAAMGIPYIISFRKSDIKNIEKSVIDKKKYRKTLSNADSIIVHNKYQQDFLKHRYGLDSHLIPHGIEAAFIKERRLAPKKEIVISAVGSMIQSKRFDWVIKAIESYSGGKKVCLRLIGNGPESERLKSLASNSMTHVKDSSSGIDEYTAKNIKIVFYGHQSHEKVGIMLEESDIFALPSAIETFGLVYMEAAATMNAVIAVRNTGVWGNFEEDKEMLYIESYKDFQKALFLLIDNDKMRIGLAKNAFRRVKDEYSWEKIIERYDLIYKKIISST